MNAKKRKSKKRSAANSKPQPDDFVFYLDRNLGKHVIADALRSIGVRVEVHDDHLPVDAPDEVWVMLVGQYKQITLTIARTPSFERVFTEIQCRQSASGIGDLNGIPSCS